MRNRFRLKNNHDRIHVSHEMTKDESEINKELLQEAREGNND